MFRLIYVTDLHGWIEGYEQISVIAQEDEITAIVNGGDMLPHARDLILTQKRFIEEYLHPYFERLDASGISYYSMLGNDDCPPAWAGTVRRTPGLFHRGY